MLSFVRLSFLTLSARMAESDAIGAGAGAIAADESTVAPSSFFAQAATANRAATSTRRFIYDLLEGGGFTMLPRRAQHPR
jgi:hypothetical protein